MDTLIWVLFGVLVFLGIVGTIMPLVPGLVMFPLAAALVYFLAPDRMSLVSVLICIFAFFASYIIDFGGTIIGARWGGASKWGILGTGLGGIIGIFWGLPGLIFGPLIGAFAGEFMIEGKPPATAVKAGLGASLGLMISAFIKVIMAIGLTILLLIDIFF